MLVVVYQYDGAKRDDLGTPRQTRLVAYGGYSHLFSAVVGVEWMPDA